MTLAAQSVTVRAGDACLVEAVSITIAPGEFVAIVGPNGAGKTTMLHVLAGDLAPTSGRATLTGVDVRSIPPNELARRRAVLPQASALVFGFRVLEIVLIGRTPHGTGAETVRDVEIARIALAQAGVEHLEDRLYTTLSGGERQRVHLARVLAQLWTATRAGERYLLLDEPTSSLDIAQQHGVLEAARRFATEGNGVLAILHDPNLAVRYADRVVVMRDGRVLADGPASTALTPEAIAATFDVRACVIPHPTTNEPFIMTEARGLQ